MSKASQSACEAIKIKILSGEFPPGAHLKEEHLAEVIGVSRTPIRDALRTLASEDYVRVVPNHGTFVSDYSDHDVEDIFALRAKLEGFAARLAARRATPEHIRELRHLCDNYAALLESDELPPLDEFLSTNRRFHDLIKEASASERLSQMIHRLVEQPVVMRTARFYSRAELTRSSGHHIELVDAIEAGNEDWAEATMTSHLQAGFQNYRRQSGSLRDKASNDAAE